MKKILFKKQRKSYHHSRYDFFPEVTQLKMDWLKKMKKTLDLIVFNPKFYAKLKTTNRKIGNQFYII